MRLKGSKDEKAARAVRRRDAMIFRRGVRDGIPVALGYFAVAFSLGIAARNAGLGAFQGFLVSLLNNASAGEYAGFTVIREQANYAAIVLVTLIANARYLLMSCALSQRFHPDMPFFHRFFIGFDVTDELFALAIARPGFVEPRYFYGAMFLPLFGWSLGTMGGVLAGNALPERIVSSLSVALFGMFLAIIVPPARKNRIIAALVGLGFLFSFVCSRLPVLSTWSEGSRTVLLTILLSSLAAFFFPVPGDGASSQEEKEGGPDEK